MHLKTEAETAFETVLSFSHVYGHKSLKCRLLLLLDLLPLSFSSQPAAETAVLMFVTHGMARRHSLFSRSLFVTILDRVACSGSRKCQVRTTHNTGKHKIELDADCVLFLIDKLRPDKEKILRLFLHTTVAYFLIYFSKTFKI